MDMEEFIMQSLSSASGIGSYRWLALGVMWPVAVAGWLVRA